MTRKKRTPEQMAVIRAFDKKTYSPIQIKPKKSEAALMREYAKLRNESLTRLIVRCVIEDMNVASANDHKLNKQLTEIVEKIEKKDTQ